MKPTTKKFFAELKKAKGKTNLRKAKKYNFARLQQLIPEMDALEQKVKDVLDGEFDTAFENLKTAQRNLKTVLDEAQNESTTLADEVYDIRGKLDELGVASDELEDAESEVKILRDWLFSSYIEDFTRVIND